MGTMDHRSRAHRAPPEGRCRPLVAVARPCRTVSFPVGDCLGAVTLRGPRESGGARAVPDRLAPSPLRRSARRWWDDGWRESGRAHGRVRVPAGCELGLRLAPGADAGALRSLLPGDLQRLSVRQEADEVLALAGHLSGLSALDLWGADVGDDAMFWVAACADLEDLDLWGTRVGPAGLLRLGCLAGLRRLTAPGPSWGDDAAAALGRFPGLRVLDLAGTMVSDRGIDRMGGVAQLTRLSLWGTRVTDQSLPLLARFSRLAAVDLGGTAITDRGLDALIDLAHLRWVSLQDTLVSREGLARLTAARPDCRVDPQPARAGYHGVWSRAARSGLRGV